MTESDGCESGPLKMVENGSSRRGVLCYFVNVAWYFELHWQERARAAVEDGWEVHLLAGQISEDFRKAMEFQGVLCHEIPLTRGSFNPLQFVAAFLYTLSCLRSINPRVLHCITLLPNLIGGLIAKPKSLPVICSVTGTGWVFSGDTFMARSLRSVVVRWFRWASRNPFLRLVFENNDDLALFEKLGVARNGNSRLILGAGVDTHIFRPRYQDHGAKASSPPSGIVRFLFASRFLYSKGLKELIEVMQALYDDGYRVSLRVCGFEDNANPDAIPSDVLGGWSELPFVEWLGHRRDMVDVLQGSDVVVLPTSYGEGVPRALIEAASCGLACIATDVAGCREIVKDGVNGILVSPGDADSLKAAISFFLNCPDAAQRYGEAGREMVLEKFDQVYVNAATLQLYVSMA